MADWKQDASTFATIAGTFLAIFVVDSAVLPYLNSTSTPIVTSLNIFGFAALIIGIGMIYVKRWPKIDEKKAVLIATQHLTKNYNATNMDIQNVENVGGKWRILVEYRGPKDSTVTSRRIVVDASGIVDSDDIYFEPPEPLNLDLV